MKQLVPPHGGELKPLLTGSAQDILDKRAAARSLPQIPLTTREVSDVIMLATGSFSPLDGFCGQADYEAILADMRLTDGTLWPIPIALAADRETAGRIKPGGKAALVDAENGALVGVIAVNDQFEYDKKREASTVFGTDDPKHPGVQKLFEQGDIYLGGTVEALSEGDYPELFPEFLRPAETRSIFAERGWETVVAFQTRNPIHRSHEYLTKVALEMCDGLFIHPIVGKLKSGDIPEDVRMTCYRTLLDRYYLKSRVVLGVYPMEMRYAGPKEALLHAIIRQNFGCSHLIVGRDHAGVGDYYGPFDAQNIFDALPPGALHLKPLKIDWTFYCRSCRGMASTKTCPHGNEDHLMISGTELRAMLAEGKRPPEEFSRPEIADILMAYYGKEVNK